MKTIGNILWFIFTGFVTAFGFVMLGVLWCISIIGIPFGLQAFKFAGLALWPFGKKVVKGKSHPIANLIWFVLGGFGLAFGYIFLGVFWCITILGIPFGKQCFKLARLAAFPFGRALA